MAVLDKINEKINQSTGVAKLNGIIAEEENRINACFHEIGKISFEKYPDNPDALIVDLVANVKESQSKIEDYSEQIKKLKGFTKCECGTDVPPDDTFCKSCGVRVRVEPTLNVSTDKRICNGCGVVIADGMAFCTECGQKIETTELINKCKGCGAKLIDGMAFCTECGQKISD